jgi:hypothetical protein
MFQQHGFMETKLPFPETMVYSFTHVSHSSQLLRNYPTKQGENIRSPSMEPHADGRHKYKWVRPGYPRESFKTLILLPQVPCSFQHDTFHLDLGRSETR